MKTFRRIGSLAAAAVMGLVCLGMLAGCSSAKSTTCQQYGQMSYGQKTSTAIDLIKAHNLDPTSNPVAAAYVSQEIDAFCGVDPVAEMTGNKAPATKNLNISIDKGVNWSKYGG